MSVCGYSFYDLYAYVPYVAFVVAFLGFVCRCSLSVRGRLLWALYLAIACSRPCVCWMFGGTALYPLGIPELTVHVLDVAYFGTISLAAISVPFFFWRSHLKAFVFPLIAYITVLVGILNSIATPIVREYVVESDLIPSSLDGYRIVHISDIHAYCGCRRWHTQKIVDVANCLDADLVCITGDIADGRPSECADYLAPLLSLKAKDGVYAVTGNHEFNASVNPVREWQAFYSSWNISFLRNNCIFPHAGLALGGVDDATVSLNKHKEYGEVPDVAKAFAVATNGEFRVLMQHQQLEVEKNVEEHRVGLQLSGHFHGGFMPGMRSSIGKEYRNRIRGLYCVGDGFLCMSAGCGPWGGFPLRFLTPLEIGLLTLKHSSAGKTK